MTMCVLPGCRNPVATVGETCPDCLAAFGTWLKPANAGLLNADEIRARDEYVERAYHAQRGMK